MKYRSVVFFVLLSVFGFQLCVAGDSPLVQGSAQAAKVNRVAEQVLNEVVENTFSSTSSVFYEKPDAKIAFKFMDNMYSTPGLIPGSKIKLTRLIVDSISEPRFNDAETTAVVDVKFKGISHDKGYLVRKELTFKKYGDEWYLRLD